MVRVEEFEGLLGPKDVDVDQGTKEDFRNLQLLVEMGQIQKNAMETRVVGICKRWMAAGRPLTPSWSPIEKKGDGCSGRVFGKLRASHSGY